MRNAFDFGASGDGKTDDTNALQHAINDGRGAVQLHKGSFRITRPLVFDTSKVGYAALLGAGGASQLLMAGAGPAVRIVGNHQGTAAPGSVSPNTWSLERFPTVTDLAIVGEHPEATGIELFRTMQATISRVLIRQCRDAIRLVERNRNFVLSDSHLYDNHRFGVFFDHCNLHQIIIHGNHISYNKRAGIKSLNGDVHNLQITGNDIEYNNRPGQDRPNDGGAEISFESPDGVISEVTIASNTIQATIEPGGANIRILGSSKDVPRGARLIAISGNVIGSQTRGIEIERAQRVAITGNTIYDSADLSLVMKQCTGVTVGSNTVVWSGLENDPPRDGICLEDCDNGILSGLVTQRLCSGTQERGGGVTLIRCRDTSISDCQLLDPLVRGIELKDCVRCRIANNTVVDRKTEKSMLHAIRVRGGAGNLIQNNLVGGAKEPAIDVSSGAAVEQGNHITTVE